MIYKILRLSFYNSIGNIKKNISLIGGVISSAIIISIFYGYISATKEEIENEYKYKNLYGDFLIQNPKYFDPSQQDEIKDIHISAEEQKIVDELLNNYSSQVESKIKFLNAHVLIENSQGSNFAQVMAYDTTEALKLKSTKWQWTATHGDILENSKVSQPITLGRSLGGLVGCVPKNPYQEFKGYDGFINQKREFYCKQSNRIRLTSHTMNGQINTTENEVVGLVSGGIREADEILAFISLADGQKLMDTKSISYYTVSVNKDKEKLIKKLNTDFSRLNLNLNAYDWKTHSYIGQFYIGTMNFFNTLINFIFFIMIFLSCICIFISFVNNIQSRRNEILTFKQIGFRSNHIYMTYFFEYFFLVFISTLAAYFIHLITYCVLKKLLLQYTAGVLIEPSILKINTSPFPLIIYFSLAMIFVLFMIRKTLLKLIS